MPGGRVRDAYQSGRFVAIGRKGVPYRPRRRYSLRDRDTFGTLADALMKADWKIPISPNQTVIGRRLVIPHE